MAVSLKIKIAASFFVSAAIIAVLVAVQYWSFTEIAASTAALEVIGAIERGVGQKDPRGDRAPTSAANVLNEMGRNPLVSVFGTEAIEMKARHLDGLLASYRSRSDEVRPLRLSVLESFTLAKPSLPVHSDVVSLIERVMGEYPGEAAQVFERSLGMPLGHDLVSGLKELGSKEALLAGVRREILGTCSDLRTIARGNIETARRVSQSTTLVLFPFFFVSGIATLYLISKNVVDRLTLLIDFAERTGRGDYSRIAVPKGALGSDETEVLIRQFNEMAAQLERREEELSSKNEELLQTKKLAAIGTLAAGVAHELNNPLMNIHISVQALQREAGESLSPFVNEVFDDIAGQTMRAKGIVSDLLEFARGKEPRFDKVDLVRVIQKALAEVRMGGGLDDISFMFRCASDKAVVDADAEQMERVFVNLFKNAADAMAGWGSLTVTVEPVSGSMRITVTDTGKGIAPAQKEKLFEPFFSTKEKGTGLGLAIVFGIINKHGGDITVQSEERMGTSFVITLPVRRG